MGLVSARTVSLILILPPRILLLQRALPDLMPGFWESSGGACELEPTSRYSISLCKKHYKKVDCMCLTLLTSSRSIIVVVAAKFVLQNTRSLSRFKTPCSRQQKTAIGANTPNTCPTRATGAPAIRLGGKRKRLAFCPISQRSIQISITTNWPSSA
ncbi:hypothetical protein PITC_043970 [Penicillium italicum]|uniref:Secreted protein n=1 Tax=Penicillium italicum TaxID=40296 RepID=A0A0A2L6U1_PENIT|nr:hypothetical protein PITC_043970 [Penicillium italicum]